jgi:4-hydroxy-tetrahydrodipicolinate synthase
MACGMEGVISVAANALPNNFSTMIRYCLKGDYRAAKKVNDKLISAYELMFAENNPAGVKAFLTELGVIENVTRLPVVPLSKGLYDKVKAYLEKDLKLAVH